MTRAFGDNQPNSTWMRLRRTAEPTDYGMVDLQAFINYGTGSGVRWVDLTPDQADELALSLIRSAAEVRRRQAQKPVTVVAS